MIQRIVLFLTFLLSVSVTAEEKIPIQKLNLILKLHRSKNRR